MDLEIIMLSEVSHTEKDKYGIIYMWKLKIKYKRIYIYNAERDSQTNKKKNLWLSKGKVGVDKLGI